MSHHRRPVGMLLAPRIDVLAVEPVDAALDPVVDEEVAGVQMLVTTQDESAGQSPFRRVRSRGRSTTPDKLTSEEVRGSDPRAPPATCRDFSRVTLHPIPRLHALCNQDSRVPARVPGCGWHGSPRIASRCDVRRSSPPPSPLTLTAPCGGSSDGGPLQAQGPWTGGSSREASTWAGGAGPGGAPPGRHRRRPSRCCVVDALIGNTAPSSNLAVLCTLC